MKKFYMFILCLIAVPAAAKTVSNDQYRTAIAQTAAMYGNGSAQSIAQKHGLQILSVTWEDTGRYKGSSVGPNISDMTIQVQTRNDATGKYELTCMPVIRYPNFEDKSGDISPDKFYLLVGNQKGKKLNRITLTEYLKNIRSYLSVPSSWKGSRTSLLAKRDSHVLVSAQACFLPVPQKGKAEFNPVLFNYQSYKNNPAVLTILATREGTSATIIDNTRDAFEAGAAWGQRLFFNQKGERASLTGTRASDYAETLNDTRKNTDAKQSVNAAEQSGLNLVLLIQVPLKQKERPRRSTMDYASVPAMSENKKNGKGDVENAVIGHGKVEGPFTEIDNLEIERDERFPIRVTVQFYKATSNGIVSESDMQEISSQIEKVYKKADYVGSLVTQGDTGRATEYDGPKFEPPDWWEQFWKRHHSNTGLTPEESMRMLRIMRGPYYIPESREKFEKDVKKLEERREKAK
jgi:hypothetical protein